ncbi:hypothetical protein KAR91_82905 [Candidatus Pacearchaeota archaeon]|nr:hypothetical protein [Candidatus Pacearchaeota archaeon]
MKNIILIAILSTIFVSCSSIKIPKTQTVSAEPIEIYRKGGDEYFKAKVNDRGALLLFKKGIIHLSIADIPSKDVGRFLKGLEHALRLLIISKKNNVTFSKEVFKTRSSYQGLFSSYAIVPNENRVSVAAYSSSIKGTNNYVHALISITDASNQFIVESVSLSIKELKAFITALKSYPATVIKMKKASEKADKLFN